MEKLKEYIYIIIVVIAILGFAFYWYELRPGIIQQKCAEWVVKNNFPILPREEDSAYKDCLWRSGLSK